jgi:hypothetical protein
MSIVLVGSTSGSITLQEPAVAGTTVLTLPAVSGNVLTDTSPKAGNVLQVVSTTTNATFSSSSTSMTSTGISLSITPTASSSKVLVRITGGNIQTTSGNAQPYFTVYRGASSLYGARGLQQCWVQSGGGFSFPLAIETLDSPATTSSTTYTLYMAVNSLTVGINTPDNAYLTFTLMEIAA